MFKNPSKKGVVAPRIKRIYFFMCSLIKDSVVMISQGRANVVLYFSRVTKALDIVD